MGSGGELGREGEEVALRHYRRAGYGEVARNWRCRLGEIDLVLVRGRTVVFCEVKTRRGTALGGPQDAVTWRKRRKLRLLAETFLTQSRLQPEQVRFDVASVLPDGRGGLTVEVFEHAF